MRWLYWPPKTFWKDPTHESIIVSKRWKLFTHYHCIWRTPVGGQKHWENDGLKSCSKNWRPGHPFYVTGPRSPLLSSDQKEEEVVLDSFSNSPALYLSSLVTQIISFNFLQKFPFLLLMTPRLPWYSPVLFHKELKGDQKVVVKVSQQLGHLFSLASEYLILFDVLTRRSRLWSPFILDSPFPSSSGSLEGKNFSWPLQSLDWLKKFSFEDSLFALARDMHSPLW